MLTGEPTSTPTPQASSIVEQLRLIWMEALDLPSVTDHDNFVDLGGDSLAATMCQQRVAAIFNVRLQNTVLLVDATTLQSVAVRIGALIDANRSVRSSTGRAERPNAARS